MRWMGDWPQAAFRKKQQQVKPKKSQSGKKKVVCRVCFFDMLCVFDGFGFWDKSQALWAAQAGLPCRLLSRCTYCRPPIHRTHPLSNPTRKKRMTRDHSQWIFCCLRPAAPSLQQIYIAFCWSWCRCPFFSAYSWYVEGCCPLSCPGMQTFPVPLFPCYYSPQAILKDRERGPTGARSPPLPLLTLLLLVLLLLSPALSQLHVGRGPMRRGVYNV